MRVALDTDVLVYAEGVNGAGMQQTARELIARLPDTDVLLPVQVLGELFNVLVRKASFARLAARAAVMSWRDSFLPVSISAAVMWEAMDLAADHQLSIWDAIVVSAAAKSGCRLLLSEDLQDGFVWGGVTVVNPFAAQRHPLLEALLSQ